DHVSCSGVTRLNPAPETEDRQRAAVGAHPAFGVTGSAALVLTATSFSHSMIGAVAGDSESHENAANTGSGSPCQSSARNWSILRRPVAARSSVNASPLRVTSAGA